MNPRFPIYIVSKGRHAYGARLTARYLDVMEVPYLIIVEAQERDAYTAVIDPARVLTLDPQYQRDYDTFDELGDSKSRGPGPARNFAWQHALDAGAAWHWVMDDNISGFYRLNRNSKILVSDGTIFRVMEDFALRYKNVAMAGPDYEMFQPRLEHCPPFNLNTRIYSCNLIRNDSPFRWRGRYNEDTDLSLRMLKAGQCTVLFNAFLQHKVRTQHVKGGNLDAFYATEGTLPKSRMLVAMHPDVARLTQKFGRWHHHVDYRPFRANKLIRNPDVPIPEGVDNYGMRLKHLAETQAKAEASGQSQAAQPRRPTELRAD